MKNNNLKWQDAKGSTIDAIISVAYPFDCFQEKIDVVTKKFHADQTPICEAKKEAFRSHFKHYYENPQIYNHYDLKIIEPF